MPNSVTIYGRNIPIKYISKKKLDQYITGAEGIWDTYTQTIYINREAPQNIQYYYIYHEIGHAIKTFVGLDQILPAELQEVIVQSFATGIQDIIKQKAKFR